MFHVIAASSYFVAFRKRLSKQNIPEFSLSIVLIKAFPLLLKLNILFLSLFSYVSSFKHIY